VPVGGRSAGGTAAWAVRMTVMIGRCVSSRMAPRPNQGWSIAARRLAPAWALSTFWCVGFAGAVGLAGLGGCVPDPVVSLDSPAPAKRIDAIARASRAQDRASLVGLVEKLGSVDPVERMLAIRALERREGETLGYDHAAPRWERIEAINRWRSRVGMDPLSDGDDGQDAEASIDADHSADAPGESGGREEQDP